MCVCTCVHVRAWGGRDILMKLASQTLPGFHGIQYNNSGSQLKDTIYGSVLREVQRQKGDKDIGGI